jgi:hypothetical protein
MTRTVRGVTVTACMCSRHLQSCTSSMLAETINQQQHVVCMPLVQRCVWQGSGSLQADTHNHVHVCLQRTRRRTRTRMNWKVRQRPS